MYATGTPHVVKENNITAVYLALEVLIFQTPVKHIVIRGMCRLGSQALGSQWLLQMSYAMRLSSQIEPRKVYLQEPSANSCQLRYM